MQTNTASLVDMGKLPVNYQVQLLLQSSWLNNSCDKSLLTECPRPISFDAAKFFSENSCSLDGASAFLQGQCVSGGGTFWEISEKEQKPTVLSRIASTIGSAVHIADRVKQAVYNSHVLPVVSGVALYQFLKDPLPEGSNKYIQFLKFIGLTGATVYSLYNTRETLFESSLNISTTMARLGTVAAGIALVPFFKRIYASTTPTTEAFVLVGAASAVLAGIVPCLKLELV